MSNSTLEGVIYTAPNSAERRLVKRRKMVKLGEIVFEQKNCLMNCSVMDLSDHGAKLKPEIPLQCPQSFILHLADRDPKLCEVVWRTGDYVGVRFDGLADFDPSWKAAQSSPHS